MLILACQTGLRVAELIGLRRADIDLGAGAHCRCTGRGRDRPSHALDRQTVAALRVWLPTPTAGRTLATAFTTSRGQPLSRDAVAKMITKHAARAAVDCPSIATKHVTPHTLRHSAAMALLHAGVDTSVIALWLGHEDPGSTQAYLHADMTIKEQALSASHHRTPAPDATAPPTLSSHSSTTSDPAGNPGLCRPTSRSAFRRPARSRRGRHRSAGRHSPTDVEFDISPQ